MSICGKAEVRFGAPRLRVNLLALTLNKLGNGALTPDSRCCLDGQLNAWCGTSLRFIPNTSNATRPKYMTAIVQRCTEVTSK